MKSLETAQGFWDIAHLSAIAWLRRRDVTCDFFLSNPAPF
jgi:hypothetical protein